MGHDPMENVLSGTNGGRDGQVSATIPCRRFTAEHELKIVHDADFLDDPGFVRFDRIELGVRLVRLVRIVGSRR